MDAKAFQEYATVFASMAIHGLDSELLPWQLQLWREVLPHQSWNFEGLFRDLADSGTFRTLWAQRGCRAPFLLPCFAFVERTITLADIANGMAEATAKGEPIPAALGLVRGQLEKINSELPPVRTPSELEQVLNFGTVFLNAASKHWPALAAVCRAAGKALGFPANINVYVTAPGRFVSTPAHSDHHDVLILQVQGEKRWRVYSPLPWAGGCMHPCHRGKGDDTIDEVELSEPLIDVRLRPGESLFVPAGFVHATSTAGMEDCADASLHLTLGFSVADCGLTLGTLHGQVLLELGEGLEEEVEEEGLEEEALWALLEPLPVGCLATPGAASADVLAAAVAGLARRLGGPELEGEALEAAAGRVAERWLRIHEDLLEIYDRGYAEVVEAAAGGIVAVGLADRPGASAFHARRRRPEDDSEAVEEAAADPSILAATSSIGEYCRFIRAHVPEAEITWHHHLKRGPVAALPRVFELVD